MSTNSRPRTRSQIQRQSQLDLDQNNDDSDISADGFEPDTIGDEWDAIRHDINVLDAGDRRKLDQFLAAQEAFIIQLREFKISYHFFNNMTVNNIENWVKKNLETALVDMNKSTRKQDKITALLKALKAARDQIRYEHDELKKYYVDIGLDERVLLGGRRVLSENKNNGGSESADRYDPAEDEQDSDVDGLDMNMDNKLNNNNKGKGKDGRNGSNGNNKNGRKGKGKLNGVDKTPKNKRNKNKNNNNNNNNQEEEISDENKNNGNDIGDIFKDLPPTFRLGLDEYIKNAWNQHAAASGLQDAPAPGFVPDQLNDKPGGGIGTTIMNGQGVPPAPEKEPGKAKYTKEQLAARKQVAQLLKGAPKSRDVC